MDPSESSVPLLSSICIISNTHREMTFDCRVCIEARAEEREPFAGLVVVSYADRLAKHVIGMRPHRWLDVFCLLVLPVLLLDLVRGRLWTAFGRAILLGCTLGLEP